MGMSKDEGSTDSVSFLYGTSGASSIWCPDFFQYLLRHAIAVPAIVFTLRNMSDAKHHPASITQHKLFSNRMMV